ncbi:hypothetical protein [Brevibacillus daliensis]|uniref:hypothetical protein n=1 Tax=Brevibacillus daliensis TaxID=2892995 RepID=UPI001E4857C3|nr:hypothetical protein [Brevibacillus daliensis]
MFVGYLPLEVYEDDSLFASQTSPGKTGKEAKQEVASFSVFYSLVLFVKLGGLQMESPTNMLLRELFPSLRG